MADKTTEIVGQKGLLKPTLQITVFSILGIAVSFFTEIFVAAKFGATTSRDAYFTAAVVPFYITAVLLGALTITFVPIFIEYETKKSKEEAWEVASIFTNITFLVLFGISLLGFIFAKQLISVTAPGFKGKELLLTASLLRILLPSIIFSGLSNILSSIYYAHYRFLRPAIAPFLSAFLILSSVVIFTRYWGIKSLAFGHLVGAVLGFFILVPILFKQGTYCFSFDFQNEGVRQVIRVMSPLVFAGLFYQATTVIERMIASTLPTGSISYLGYANKIITILGTIATMGISTTIFSSMARHWAQNDLEKVREYFAKGVRIIMLITLPIAMVFVVFRVQIIQAFFERGAFDHNTTIAVANILLILLIAFILSGLGSVVGKGFYISQRTKLVAILNIIEMIIYLCVGYFLSRVISYIGLSIAYSTKFIFGFTTAIIVMRRIFGGLNGKKILEALTKILIASLCGGISIYYSFRMVFTGSILIVRLVEAGILGVIIYAVIVVYILKLEEASLLKKKMLDNLRSFQIWKKYSRSRHFMLL